MTQYQLDINLIKASIAGNLEEVKSAIENGANIHAEDDYALILASEEGHKEVVKYLKKVAKKEKNKGIKNVK